MEANKKVEELTAEEVNVYANECGEIQFHCMNDCFGGGAYISEDW